MLSGNGEYYQRVTIKNFIQRSFIGNGSLTSIGMNALNLMMFIIGFDILVSKKIIDKSLRKRYISMSIILLVGWIIYGFVLLLIYLFVFTSSEAMILACYERYMLTIPFAIVLTNVAILVKKYKDDKIKISNIVFFITIILVFMPIKDIKDIYINKEKNIEETIVYRKEYKEILKYSDVLELNDKVYYISNFENEREILIVTYEFLPLKIANRNGKLTMGREKFIEILKNEEYTHIYVNLADNVLRKKYIDLFENENIEDKTMYKIVKNEDSIKFVKM